VTLDRADLAKQASFVHEPRKLPVVLSPEEVARLLEAAPGIKYKATLSVAYGAGLRVSEVASLKVSNVDSKRMMLRVEQGKGHKDRHAMLSPQLLGLLRDWYRIARPQGVNATFRAVIPGRRASQAAVWQRREGLQAGIWPFSANSIRARIIPESGFGPLRHLRAARTSRDSEQGGRR
jgi:integrase